MRATYDISGFPNANSQPSYALWAQAVRIKIAGVSSRLPKSPGEARSVMPDAAHHPFSEPQQCGVGRGAGPETGPASDMANAT